MQAPSSIKLPAKLESLERLIGFVSDCAAGEGIERKRITEIEIATEEALVNIFNYAYEGKDGDVEVVCRADNNDRFIIEIMDLGVPFNLLSLQEPDTSLDISDRQIGGLGIFLIRNLMDDVQYRREESRNILTLIASKKHPKTNQ